MGNSYSILVGKPEDIRPLARPRYSWEDNIRMDLWEIDWEVWTGCIWLVIGPRAGPCEHGNELSGSIKSTEFDWLSDYWLLEKDSAPCS
jgi:hypothetical protein